MKTGMFRRILATPPPNTKFNENLIGNSRDHTCGRTYTAACFLAYFPYLENKIKVRLCDNHAVCVSVNPPYQLLNA
jgi:hypothetical protein